MENIITIKKINWLSKDAKEAEVFFEKNNKEFWAFCHPCNFNVGETVEVYFSFIEEDIADSVFWNENIECKQELVPSQNDKLRYYCYGKLESINPVIINCGEITLSFGNWINDKTTIGQFVYFVISRFDIGHL